MQVSLLMFTSLLIVARFIRVKVAPVKSIPLALAFSDITEKFIVAPSKSIAVLLLVQNGTDSPTGGGSVLRRANWQYSLNLSR